MTEKNRRTKSDRRASLCKRVMALEWIYQKLIERHTTPMPMTGKLIIGMIVIVRKYTEQLIPWIERCALAEANQSGNSFIPRVLLLLIGPLQALKLR